MRHCFIAALLVLTACGKDVRNDMVSPNVIGQSVQRADLEPNEQLAFDRYTVMPGVPYAIDTKNGETVGAAVHAGTELLRSDAAGETSTPAKKAEEAAAREAKYRDLVTKGRRECDGLEPKYERLCLEKMRDVLARLGVPDADLPR